MDGFLVSDRDGLCDTFRSFYLDLFSAAPCDALSRSELLSHVSSVLPPDQCDLCEGLLSQEECCLALWGMASDKAPGRDGLPMEFYLKFWPVDVLNSAYVSDRLSSSQRCGIISLSFKKGDRLDPKNWRPITLLNVAYKIASRTIAARAWHVACLAVSSKKMLPSFAM